MKRPAIGHVLGYAALTVILTAGAAQSLSGSNTVFTDDIADGNVTSADIKDGKIKSIDVKDDALTGADIDESTLSLPGGSSPTFYEWTLHHSGGWTDDGNNRPTTWSDGTITGPAVVVPVSGTVTNQSAIGAACGALLAVSFERRGSSASSGRDIGFVQAGTIIDGPQWTLDTSGGPFTIPVGRSVQVGGTPACLSGEGYGTPPAFDAKIVMAAYPIPPATASPTVID